MLLQPIRMDTLSNLSIENSVQSNSFPEPLKTHPTFVIKKLKDLLSTIKKLNTESPNRQDELLEISKKLRNLSYVSFLDGKERAEKYTTEGRNFYNSLTKGSTDIFQAIQNADSNFLDHKKWHEIKIKEFLDEVELCNELTEINSTNTSSPIITKFIDDSGIENHYYKILIEQINKSYHYKLYTILLVLIRKLFENLFIDILRKKYSQNTELYLNKRGKHHPFYQIISNTKEKIQLGEFDSVKSDFNEVILWVEKLRSEGGKSAHSITFDLSKNEIDILKNDTNRKLNLLYHRVFSMLK